MFVSGAGGIPPIGTSYGGLVLKGVDVHAGIDVTITVDSKDVPPTVDALTNFMNSFLCAVGLNSACKLADDYIKNHPGSTGSKGSGIFELIIPKSIAGIEDAVTRMMAT